MKDYRYAIERLKELYEFEESTQSPYRDNIGIEYKEYFDLLQELIDEKSKKHKSKKKSSLLTNEELIYTKGYKGLTSILKNRYEIWFMVTVDGHKYEIMKKLSALNYQFEGLELAKEYTAKEVGIE